MTQDKLNYLLILAEEQNLTRAAQRLYITQPTLTGFLNRLERDLGFLIFDRSVSPVRLTPSGKRYLEGMQKILQEEHTLKEQLRCEAKSRIQLRIGLGQVHSQIMAPAFTERLLQRHPQLNLQLCESKESLLMEMLQKGEIDLFLGHVRSSLPAFQFGEVMTEHLLLLMPRQLLSLPQEVIAQNTPAAPYPLTPEQLQGLPIIAPAPTQSLYFNYMELLEHFRIAPGRVVQTANQVTAIRLAARGLGYLYSGASLLSFLTTEEQKQLIFCTIPGLSDTRKFYYAYPQNHLLTALIQETIEVIRSINDLALFAM